MCSETRGKKLAGKRGVIWFIGNGPYKKGGTRARTPLQNRRDRPKESRKGKKKSHQRMEKKTTVCAGGREEGQVTEPFFSQKKPALREKEELREGEGRCEARTT